MTTKIPDQLKADMPQTTWGRILLATPVVMTVVASVGCTVGVSSVMRMAEEAFEGSQKRTRTCEKSGRMFATSNRRLVFVPPTVPACWGSGVAA